MHKIDEEQHEPQLPQLFCDIAVIGGGAAGMAAAQEAAASGKRVTLIEREPSLGGILKQCIHDGFGLHRFKMELTGPEYAYKDIDRVESGEGIDVLLDTSALSIRQVDVQESTSQDARFSITLSGPQVGYVELNAGAVVVANGARERSRGALNIPGGRPVGVFSAGVAQRLCNIEGALAGKRVVILGSGDIGLIMARRMTFLGARVLCVAELMPVPGGLRRNIVQCLEDYGIELCTSTTVVEIHGDKRLEGVTLAQVDPKTFAPIEETKRFVACDTLLLSVGLIPENELCEQMGIETDPKTQGPCVDQHLMTSIPGIFVAGNQLHVHDLVDFVSEEGALAGSSAAAWLDAQKPIRKELEDVQVVSVEPGMGVGSITPQRLVITDNQRSSEQVMMRLRSNVSLVNATLRVIATAQEPSEIASAFASLARQVQPSCDVLVKQVKARVVVPSEMQEILLRLSDIPAGTTGLRVEIEGELR